MLNTKLSSYSKEELYDVLRILKSYRSSLKQIGKRAKLKDDKQKIAKIFRIEYAGEMDKNFLENFSAYACGKFFPEAAFDAQKEYIQNNEIVGGIRIFYGDDMMDLSFADYARAFN